MQRRFTDKPDLDPGAVWSLDDDHPAMVENRTLFPSTVVEVTEDEPDRLLVSGANNRKLGKTVMKGALKGYALYGLSLEERATCPDTCGARGFCYGNGMQMARRHRIGDPDTFYDRLGLEICELLDEHKGLLIRLHVLGDFPDTEYVAFWKEVLDEHPNVVCYGYTARKTANWGGDEIGDAIQAVKDVHPGRFRIRWSSEVSRDDGAVIIDYVPDSPIVDEGTICPAQIDKSACCASCGLCWSKSHLSKTIVFIKHGKSSLEVAAANGQPKEQDNGTRKIAPIEMPSGMKPAVVDPKPPEMRVVAPETLQVEASYQRDLSARSIRLIRKIVTGWDWSKYKPPVCVEAPDGLFAIDGQHTAIAAATHKYIKRIPVLVVSADRVEQRAAAFVSHNRDRLNMTPAQVFYAECTAGVKEAKEIMKLIVAAGAEVPRNPVAKAQAKPGQLTAIVGLKRIYKRAGAELTARILRIAVASEVAPIAAITLRGLQLLLSESLFAEVAALGDDKIAAALKYCKNMERKSRAQAEQTGQSQYRVAAIFIAQAAGAYIAMPGPKADLMQRPRDEVEERLIQLEEALRDNVWQPEEWGLTGAEGDLLNALVGRALVSSEQIHTILYGNDPDGGPDLEVINVYLCKMRPKLEPFGIEIETKWGDGFRLTGASQKIIAGLKTQAEAA